MRRALSLLLLLTASLGFVTGCKEEDGNAPVKQPKTFYHTIVSLSPGTTEVLAGSFGVALAGRTASDNWPIVTVDRIPVVASVKPDYEKLAETKPDLLVYDASLYNDQDQKKFESLGAAQFKIDANTWQDYRKQLFEMASLLGQETRASDYVDRVTVELRNAQAKTPAVSPKVAVMMADPSGHHMIAGTGSFVADIVKQIGGTPVGPSGTTFVPASPETIVSENPEVIFVNGTQENVKGAEALLKDPRFQSVNAIKNKRVRVINSDVLLRRGARVDMLVKAMYPTIANAGEKK